MSDSWYPQVRGSRLGLELKKGLMAVDKNKAEGQGFPIVLTLETVSIF